MSIFSVFNSDLKSKNFCVYGNIFGLVSSLALVGLSVATFFFNIIYSIIGIVFGVIVFCIEYPVFTKVLMFFTGRLGERISPSMLIERAPGGKYIVVYARPILYVLMTTVLWATFGASSITMLIGTIFINITAICYVIGAFKGDEQVRAFGMDNHKKANNAETNPYASLPI
ncbi:hypothetical protein H4219_001774 [Mycoemilia scoparia]|uniref:Golgi apparatus membrane protein TVP18 n=1 Tax=Mycoemilia scoparia TaxID=417184 RepID=A0A9W8DVM5_9FUNG|nr:hypothetical protein H4219_001774 [Mycoemilia scoparia]